MLRTFAMIAFGLAFTVWLTAWAVTSFSEHDASTGAPRLEGLIRDAVDAVDDAIGGSADSAADVSGSPGPRFSWTPDWGRLPLRRRYP